MPTWAAWHDFTPSELEAAQLDAIIDNMKVLFPVGMYVYRATSATTAETFIDGCWLECNGVSVLRATYPDLNTLLSGMSYPFGTVDGTHFTLPDAQGRAPVSMASGGHTTVNALGDSDGLAKASRTPVVAAHTHSTPSHTHTGTTGNNDGATGISAGGGFAAAHTHAHSFTTASGGSGTSGSGGGDSGNFIVAGTLFIKAVA